MQTRTFGASASQMPLLGLGCSRIGSFNNPMSRRDSDALLGHALDLGIGLFDTADIYGQGDSERAIGRLLALRRDQAFVITKVGRTFSKKMQFLRPLKPIVARSAYARSKIAARREGVVSTDFAPEAIRRAIEGSLRRLRFDFVDALLLHSPSSKQLEDDRLIEVLAAAQRSGKIAHYGVACDDVACLKSATRLDGIALVEVTPDVLSNADTQTHDIIRCRRIGVVLREVVRCRRDLEPRAAVREAAGHPLSTAVVVGSSSRDHLREIAQAIAGEMFRRAEEAAAI